jgi:hypothetical protein
MSKDLCPGAVLLGERTRSVLGREHPQPMFAIEFDVATHRYRPHTRSVRRDAAPGPTQALLKREDPSGGTTGRVKPYGRLGWMGARAEYSHGEG